jgi:hypothetical protein
MDAMENVPPEDWLLVLSNFHRALKEHGYFYFTAETIENADVCLLLLDATRGLEAQDMNILTLILRNSKGLIILVNKWDLVEEKDSNNPPPGFPGLETALPLLLTAVNDGRLTMDDIIARSYTNPRRIFNLPEQPETWVEVDENAVYEIKAENQFTRCGWTPFEGWQVKGRVRKVVLRGKTAFEDRKIFVEQGYGKNVREK